MERPRICLIDIADDTCKEIEAAGFNCFIGTLGSIIEVPNKKPRDVHPCLLNYKFPPNIHEYDIVIVDLQNTKRIPYLSDDHEHSETRGRTQIALVSSFPATLFDPRPLASSILEKELHPLFERETLFIIFAANNLMVEYFPVHITASGPERLNEERHWLYDFYTRLPSNRNLVGKDTEVVLKDDSELKRLLMSHNSDAVYQIVFDHPTHWEDRKTVKDKDFIPLVVAGKDQIVSFAYFKEKNCSFLFPQIQNKNDFILDLLQKVLPETFPKVFPYSTQFAWLKNPMYRLPNEQDLIDAKDFLQNEYKKKLEEIEYKLQANRESYRYLHNLLIQSGRELVKSVEKYLKWLGFNNVVDMDETSPNTLEEDIQIETEKGLLVIEIKGIGGTSTDSDCSQIAKVKYRRAKERGSFDVYGLYLVNHQRYLPPEDRVNPPFSDQQKQDAENEERGLLSTYELFKLHFNIEAGFCTKEDARDALFQTGIVNFQPSNAILIPAPYDIHYNRHVLVFKLEKVVIKKGMSVILDYDGRYKSAIIEEIQTDGDQVDMADSGEVGIKLSEKVSKTTKLWISPNS